MTDYFFLKTSCWTNKLDSFIIILITIIVISYICYGTLEPKPDPDFMIKKKTESHKLSIS